MSDHEHKNCKHCENIRKSAEILVNLTFLNWRMRDIAQCLAVIHSRIRRQCVNKYGVNSDTEKDYLKWFNSLCDKEFEYINEKNPIEPQFDEGFDFRKSLKEKS